MFLKKNAVALLLALGGLVACPGLAQDSWLAVGDVDVNFLLNYYQQDGENSPVTGGVGTEEMDVMSPVIMVGWRVNEDWTLRTDIGVDSITSASIDNMDDNVSSASRQDSRAFTKLTGSRTFGKSEIALSAGFSSEYDYKSIHAGASWSRSINDGLDLSASLYHYSDRVDLYDIDGVNQGEDDRTTTDLSLGLVQVLGPKTQLSIELYLSEQSGFLSTPFHEVHLGSGEIVTERLPDARSRQAVGFWLNHAFSKRFVQRVHYRFYNDDWGIQGHTIALEPHFRLSERSNSWVYPILRYHTQTAADYFAPQFGFDGTENFYTSDYDLSEFTSTKIGFGWRRSFSRTKGWMKRMRSLETRITYYDRDDGLESISASLAWSWRF